MSRPLQCCFGVLLALVAGCSPPSPESNSPPAATGADTVPAARGSSIAFTLAERDLLPESLAYDTVERAFYVGSTRKGKVVRIGADGTARDFLSSRQDGLWMVMGLEIDPERRHLWVASSEGANLEGARQGRGNAAGLFQFDLASGELVARWLLDEPGGTHFFNDLVVTPAGDVYATHMFNKAAVHVVLAADPRLQVFAQPGNFRGANGIARAPDGTLYVASREGLSRFDPATAARTRLALPEGAAFSPVDGLYHHAGSLVTIHPEENLIRRLRLDPSGDAVTEIEVLEAANPLLDGPTTGVVVGDDLYYVANPQFDRLAEGRLPSLQDLDETVILRLPLGE